VLERGLLAASPEILDEVEEVLGRPKFGQWLSDERRQGFVRRIRVAARLLEPLVRVRECRDVTDDKYLEAAIAAVATEPANDTVIIVSDDQDLLVLDPWRSRIRILKPEGALAVLLGG
jgi:putative PIN family toxin of toxin-antitoxin system